MRPMVILLLLASTAAPALAGPDDDKDQRSSRAEMRAAVRAERSESRQARIERTPSAERPEHAQPPERAERIERLDRIDRASGQREQPRAPSNMERPFQRAEDSSSRAGSRRTWQPRQRSDVVVSPQGSPSGRGWTQQPRDGDVADRRFRRAPDRRLGDREDRLDGRRSDEGTWNGRALGSLAVSSVPRAGTQPPLRIGPERPSWSSAWSRDWRDDRRYDWRNHRDRNRSLFHIGLYYDPFGWDYQRYNVGWRMWPSYYSRSRWLHDPWMYRLPPPYPGTQWIRYHGDAILVDIWTGEVVDVIYDFFW